MGERSNFFTKLLDASEMYCSLKYESISGCPYDAFTPKSIAMLSIACSLCGIVALVCGM